MPLSPKRKAYKRKQWLVWYHNNGIKHDAEKKVYRAIKAGLLVRPDACEDCNKPCRPHGHHDDYLKPLEVRFLCPKCHSGWHKENGEGKTIKGLEQ